MEKIVCVVQCIASDLYDSRDSEDYVIGIAKKSNLFDRIVIAVPDVKESDIFVPLAKTWGVDLYKGSVNDITLRFLGAVGDADIIARVLLKRSYLDINLVSEMINMIKEKKVDYINLPYDFNYELAADIFTKKALQKVSDTIPLENKNLRFNPWFVMETSGDFSVLTHPGSDNYTNEKVIEVKKKTEVINDNQFSPALNSPISAYAPIELELIGGEVILDIATGRGGTGAIILSKKASQVIGVDISEEAIQISKDRLKQYPESSDKISFVCQDAMTFIHENKFDAIVSIHTAEHLPDPLEFLKLCYKNLKKLGKLFIEVPLLLPRPLGEPLYYFHTKEFLKLEIEDLLVKAGFIINKKIGRNRNIYTGIECAREAVQYHCSKNQTEE